MINDKNTHAFTEFFPHALDKTIQPALGKFPTKIKISMITSNSADVMACPWPVPGS
jgi:hypothetical protein